MSEAQARVSMPHLQLIRQPHSYHQDIDVTNVMLVITTPSVVTLVTCFKLLPVVAISMCSIIFVVFDRLALLPYFVILSGPSSGPTVPEHGRHVGTLRNKNC